MSDPCAVEVTGPDVAGSQRILTPAALAFLAELQNRFGPRRDELLTLRGERRDALAAGARLDFLPETADVRAGDWQVAPIPAHLRDRRVEITGPTDRKMTINALNSGAKVWLADMEDANTPHWANVIDGQVNLADAVRRDITLDSGGRSYALNDETAVIVMRPRGWHLPEKHLHLPAGPRPGPPGQRFARPAPAHGGGEPLAGALVDFGLYFFHNAAELLARGAGPAFYLPKMESHLEARLWAEVFAFAEDYCDVPAGSVRATVLIETIWAAFEMDEILYELRDYIAGLNAGRWDYLFSIVKTFRDAGGAFVLPERNSITMSAPFMQAYSDLLVATCHRRGAYAIGGMAAFIPSRDPQANETAFAKVRADKQREAGAGYEGSWVAHPGLVGVCAEIFDDALGGAVSQPGVGLGADVSAADLLDVGSLHVDGRPVVTEAGVRSNADVALRYVATWLAGRGAVAIHSLMEDAATAEISRSQLWQWRRAGIVLEGGQPVSADFITGCIDDALQGFIAEWTGDPAVVGQARDLLVELTTSDDYADFLTLRAYELID